MNTAPPTEPLESVMSDWLRDVRVNEEGHYNAAKAYRKYHTRLGWPVVIFSALVASSSYFAMENSENTALKAGAVVVGAVAVILAAIQSFSRFAETAEAHHRAGAKTSARFAGVSS